MKSRPDSSPEETPGAGTHETDVFFTIAAQGRTTTNPWAYGTSAVVNGGLAAILLLMGLRAAGPPMPRPLPGPHIDLSPFRLQLPPSAQTAHGGGGGGANDLIDPRLGRNPRFDQNPLMPPQVPVLENPKLILNPAIAVPPDVRLPDNPLPQIGVHQSANVLLVSSGPGGHSGIGTGSDGGDGPGNGPGHGPGINGGVGDSVYRPGMGGVSNPVPILTPEAEFSDEARRAKYQGAVLVSIIVDTHGNPQNLRIVRSLGMGLDEKALEAVRRYRFKPAMKGGRPVPVFITVEVNFRLY